MDFIAYGKRKILEFLPGVPIGQDYIPFVNPDGTHRKALVNDLPTPEPASAITIAQLQAYTGQTGQVYYIKGNGTKNVALYRAGDLSTDNGTSVIVTADGRRYFLMTQTEFNERIATVSDLWDI